MLADVINSTSNHCMLSVFVVILAMDHFEYSLAPSMIVGEQTRNKSSSQKDKS